MQILPKYQIKINESGSISVLNKGIHLVILHCNRIPPHIGLIIDKKFHSLTIKGHEINVSLDALIRNIQQKKIESLFIKIKPHPTFSEEYLKEHFISNIQEFEKVAIDKATCLSPVKSFFDEMFHISKKDINFIFELLSEIEQRNLIENVTSLNINSTMVNIPIYTFKEINNGIELANKEAETIKNTIKQ